MPCQLSAGPGPALNGSVQIVQGRRQSGENRGGKEGLGTEVPSRVQGRSPGRGFGEAEVFLLHLNKILTLPEIHFFCIIAVPLAGKILYKLLVNK